MRNFYDNEITNLVELKEYLGKKYGFGPFTRFAYVKMFLKEFRLVFGPPWCLLAKVDFILFFILLLLWGVRLCFY